MLDAWKENLVLRIAVVAVLWAIVAAVVFIWDPFGAIGGLGGLSRWATLGGTLIAGIALILNPILEDYA